MTSLRVIEIKNVHASFTRGDYHQAVVGEDFSAERSGEENPDNGAMLVHARSALVWSLFIFTSAADKQTLTRAALFIAARDRIGRRKYGLCTRVPRS